MISPKSRLIIPYGLTTLLEGVSRAILKTNPPNITQFAEVYFKELTVFREENTSLDIQDLVKKFHHTTVERWSEGTTQKKKPNGVKEPERTSVVSHEPKRLEKSTDTEEDNVTRPKCSDKTTQFPSVHAELLSEPEAAADTARGSKPSTLKNTIPPPSPPPLTLSPEFAYVPADPAQFAAQMLGKVASTHSDSSDILMVDVATSMPVLSEEALGSEAEDHAVAAPIACSGKVVGGIMSQTSVHVGLGSEPKDYEGKPTTTSSVPMQDEQEPPAYDQAAKVPLQADIVVTSIVHISSITNDEPVIEVVVSVEQIPQQRVVPFTDHVACPTEHKQSPPVSPRLVGDKTASGVSEKSVGSAKLVQFEDTKGDTSVNVEVKGSTTTVCLENSLHLEVPGSPGQESCEHAASRAPEGEPVLPGEAAGAAHPAAPVRSSGGPPLPVPEMEPEWETAPEPGLMESAIAASEAGQPPPYSNKWTLYCLTDMNQQSRPSPPPAPGPFPQAILYLSNPKEPHFLQHPPKVTSPAYVMMEDSKKGNAPAPFILVGSHVQEAPDWKPLPGHAVVSQSDALKRYAVVQVPTAVPADQKFQKHTPNPQNGSPSTSGQDVPRPQGPVFLSIAFPVGEVAEKGSGSSDKHTPFGSYGIAGEITVTTAHVHKAETQNW